MLTGYLYIGSDHMDAGVPCGKSWISPKKKCSTEGKAYTKANRQGDRDKAAQRLREERKLKSYAKRKMTRPEIAAEELAKAKDRQQKDVDVLRNKAATREEKLAAIDKLKKQGMSAADIKKYLADGLPDDQKAKLAEKKQVQKNKKMQKEVAEKEESESKPKDPAKAAKPIERKTGQQSAGGPIEDQETFDYEVTRAFKQINRDFNRDGQIEIKDVRKVLGNRVSDEDFEKMLLKGNSEDRFELSDYSKKGESPEGAIKTALGKPRTHLKLGAKSINIPDSKIDDLRDGRKTGKPPIKKADEFKAKAIEAIKSIDKGDNLTPVYALRREMGDQVNRREFSDWLFKMQADGLIELSGGSVSGSQNESDIKDSLTTKIGKLRTYVKILDNRKDSFIHIPTLERNHQASVNQGMDMLYTLESEHYDSGYIHIDWERLDAVCKSPDDKDARGRRCGQRATSYKGAKNQSAI